MPITIDGSGTITGLSAGGLPDSSIVTADIANAAITAAKLDGAQSGSAPIYAARAWVNFNGTGTVAIRASGNVSSITDLGVGNYRVNLTSAMPDTSYAVCMTSTYDNSAAGRICSQDNRLGTKTTSQFFISTDNGSAYADSDQVGVSIFR